MNRKTFSESFSKWVRNCSSMQWQSTLHSFGKSRSFELKIGHEPPDSDLRLQLRCLGIKELWKKKRQLPANCELDNRPARHIQYSAKTLAKLGKGRLVASDCVGTTQRGRETCLGCFMRKVYEAAVSSLSPRRRHLLHPRFRNGQTDEPCHAGPGGSLGPIRGADTGPLSGASEPPTRAHLPGCDRPAGCEAHLAGAHGGTRQYQAGSDARSLGTRRQRHGLRPHPRSADSRNAS